MRVLAVAAVATLRARAGAARTLGASLLSLVALLLGLGGLVLAGLWGFTDHAIAWGPHGVTFDDLM